MEPEAAWGLTPKLMDAKLGRSQARRDVAAVLVEFQLELPQEYPAAKSYVYGLEALEGRDYEQGRQLNREFLKAMGYRDDVEFRFNN